MATLRVYGVSGEILHEEEIDVGGARNARRVTRKCGQLVASTPDARVMVQTKRGEEARKLVQISKNYYTRQA